MSKRKFAADDSWKCLEVSLDWEKGEWTLSSVVCSQQMKKIRAPISQVEEDLAKAVALFHSISSAECLYVSLSLKSNLTQKTAREMTWTFWVLSQMTELREVEVKSLADSVLLDDQTLGMLHASFRSNLVVSIGRLNGAASVLGWLPFVEMLPSEVHLELRFEVHQATHDLTFRQAIATLIRTLQSKDLQNLYIRGRVRVAEQEVFPGAGLYEQLLQSRLPLSHCDLPLHTNQRELQSIRQITHAISDIVFDREDLNDDLRKERIQDLGGSLHSLVDFIGPSHSITYAGIFDGVTQRLFCWLLAQFPRVEHILILGNLERSPSDTDKLIAETIQTHGRISQIDVFGSTVVFGSTITNALDRNKTAARARERQTFRDALPSLIPDLVALVATYWRRT